MANRKQVLYGQLKAQGWAPEKPYATYLLAELEQIARDRGDYKEEYRPPAEDPELPQLLLPDEDYGARRPANAAPPAPAPEEFEVKRVDEQGRRWIMEEVKKPAYPKPRGRRVLTYLETGVKTETVQNGDYVETFEVAGDRSGRPSEVKITLPSYQVGIYIDPRFPMFKVHIYNEQTGFDLFDVENFYGGAELVPAGVKRIYVENDLCYDIRSVVHAINAEYRQMQLTGRAQ